MLEELAKEIYQEFYKNLLENYIRQNEQHVKISTRDDVTEVTWPNKTIYKGISYYKLY